MSTSEAEGEKARDKLMDTLFGTASEDADADADADPPGPSGAGAGASTSNSISTSTSAAAAAHAAAAAALGLPTTVAGFSVNASTAAPHVHSQKIPAHLTAAGKCKLTRAESHSY